jgi:hypothetical protein
MVRQQIIGRECDKIVAQGMDLACNQTISFISTMTCTSLKGEQKECKNTIMEVQNGIPFSQL